MWRVLSLHRHILVDRVLHDQAMLSQGRAQALRTSASSKVQREGRGEYPHVAFSVLEEPGYQGRLLGVRSGNALVTLLQATREEVPAMGPLNVEDPLYDAFRRHDRYGPLGARPQPFLEYVRLAILGLIFVPIKFVGALGCVVAVWFIMKCALHHIFILFK